MTDFISRFLARAAATPDHVAFTLVESGVARPLTSGALLDGASRYAALFRSAGAKPGEVVLISLKTSFALYESFIGALWVGCIPAMMPFPSAKQAPDLFWQSHNALFTHLGGGVILTFPENVGLIAQNTTPGLMRAITPQQAVEKYDGPFHAWQPHETCCLQHSSGTTGLKKGVMLTLDGITRQIASYVAAAGMAPEDTLISWLPLYHDMGFIANLVLPLAYGNHVAVISPFEWLANPLALFDMVEKFDGRFTWLPNFAFHHLVRSAEGEVPRDLSGMKSFINCSEPSKADTFDLFLEAFAGWGVRADQLGGSYGMAETVFSVSQTKPGRRPTQIAISRAALQERARVEFTGDDLDRIVGVGPPVPGLEVKIDHGEVGEILVRGPFVFTGYYRQDRPDVFVDGWYRTGDIGFFHDGEIFVLGRKKDMIIVLGRNVFAHELEMLVHAVPGVKPGRSVALGVFNAEIGSEEIVIVAEEDGTRPAKSVRAEIRTVLESTLALVPKQIMIVELGWLVKSTSGKISRSGNLEKWMSQAARKEMVA